MRRTHAFILVLIIIALIAALITVFTNSRSDNSSTKSSKETKSLRIVSLTPSNTEILFALGLDKEIVGVTRYCDYPPAARKKAKIGDMKVSIEAVAALKPNLILAHSYMNDAAIPRLRQLGFRVVAVDPKTIDQVIQDIRKIGKITHRSRIAENIAANMKNAVNRIRKSRLGKPVRKVLVAIQSNPLWVAGPGTFVNEMLQIANAENVAFDARPGFVTFSRELAISRNPDVIITGLKSDVDFFMNSPLWKNVNAVRNKRVYVIDNDMLLRPGPRLTNGLEQLAKN